MNIHHYRTLCDPERQDTQLRAIRTMAVRKEMLGACFPVEKLVGQGGATTPAEEAAPRLKFSIQVFTDARDDNGHIFRATTVYQVEAASEQDAYRDAAWSFRDAKSPKFGAIVRGHHTRFP